MCSRVYDGELTMLTPLSGVRTGKEAWQEARLDVLTRTVWLLRSGAK
jgi:hypothetical protein